jgi:hypothetical protein
MAFAFSLSFSAAAIGFVNPSPARKAVLAERTEQSSSAIVMPQPSSSPVLMIVVISLVVLLGIALIIVIVCCLRNRRLKAASASFGEIAEEVEDPLVVPAELF